jgi:hypothetical protein
MATFDKQWWIETLQLNESPPIEFETDDYEAYVNQNRDKIDKASAVFNLPIQDMTFAFVGGQEVVLSDDMWSKLENSKSYKIKSLDDAIQLALKAGIDPKPYIDFIKDGKELPLPMVLCYAQDKYYLVGGDIILSLYKALGSIPTVLQGTLNLQTRSQHEPLEEEAGQSVKDKHADIVKYFVKFAAKELGLKQLPTKITLSYNTDDAKNQHSFGHFDPSNDKIWVYVKDRNTADFLRTLAHELVHRKQAEDGRLEPGDGATGSDIENEANAQAGVLLRKFGKEHEDIYETLNEAFIREPGSDKYKFQIGDRVKVRMGNIITDDSFEVLDRRTDFQDVLDNPIKKEYVGYKPPVPEYFKPFYLLATKFDGTTLWWSEMELQSANINEAFIKEPGGYEWDIGDIWYAHPDLNGIITKRAPDLATIANQVNDKHRKERVNDYNKDKPWYQFDLHLKSGTKISGDGWYPQDTLLRNNLNEAFINSPGKSDLGYITIGKSYNPPYDDRVTLTSRKNGDYSSDIDEWSEEVIFIASVPKEGWSDKERFEKYAPDVFKLIRDHGGEEWDIIDSVGITTTLDTLKELFPERVDEAFVNPPNEYEFKIGDRVKEVYGDEYTAVVLGMVPNIEAALNDKENPSAADRIQNPEIYMEDPELADMPWYLIEFDESELILYWPEDELARADDINEAFTKKWWSQKLNEAFINPPARTRDQYGELLDKKIEITWEDNITTRHIETYKITMIDYEEGIISAVDMNNKHDKYTIPIGMDALNQLVDTGMWINPNETGIRKIKII